MTKTIGKDIIPLLIAVILVLISVGMTLFTDYTLIYTHYAGMSLIGLSLVLYFINKKLFVLVFGLTVILGTINLIDIYYWNLIFGIGPIRINPIFLTLLIVFIVFNKKMLNKIFPEKEMSEQDLAERNAEAKIKRIENYELKFESRSELELKRIADENNGYVEEARIAARKILTSTNVL